MLLEQGVLKGLTGLQGSIVIRTSTYSLLATMCKRFDAATSFLEQIHLVTSSDFAHNLTNVDEDTAVTYK